MTLSWSEIRRSQQRFNPRYTKAHTARQRSYPVRVKRTDMDYGERERIARLADKYATDHKPTVRLKRAAGLLIVGLWVVVLAAYWLITRGVQNMALATSNRQQAPKARTDIGLKLERERLCATLERKIQYHASVMALRREQYHDALQAEESVWLEDNAALLARLRVLDEMLGS